MRSAKADVATSWAMTKRAAQSSMYTCNMHYNPPILGFHRRDVEVWMDLISIPGSREVPELQILMILMISWANWSIFGTWKIGTMPHFQRDQSVTLAFLQVSKLESHLASKNPLEILVLRHEFTANVGSVLSTIWLWLTVRHGKIHPFLIGKPPISMGHLYHGELLVITRLGIFWQFVYWCNFQKTKFL